MRFPIDLTAQVRCPVCKQPGPGTNPPGTPRPEVASLTFTVMSQVRGASRAIFLGSHLMFGWDSGVKKSKRSRASLGAAFVAARKDAGGPNEGEMEISFCSTRCLRRFLNEAVDDLERRVEAIAPQVAAAKAAPGGGEAG